MAPRQTGKPPGVPQKIIDWEVVDNLLMAACNGREIASYLGVHPDTLYDRCQLEKGTVFSHYAQKGVAKGDSLLRATQMEVAIKKKDRSMLQYLGRVRLKQSELIEETQEQIGDLRQAILEISQTVSGVSDDLRQKLENASSLQDQGCTREMPHFSTELGAEGVNRGSSSLSDYLES